MNCADWNLPAPRYARFRIEYVPRRGYSVISPEGNAAEGPFTCRQTAEARCDALQVAADAKAKRGPRPCMCCGGTFHSEGIHNRMCPRCRGRQDHLGDVAFAGAQDGRKPRRAAKV